MVGEYTVIDGTSSDQKISSYGQRYLKFSHRFPLSMLLPLKDLIGDVDF